jgi:hypothetical protein
MPGLRTSQGFHQRKQFRCLLGFDSTVNDYGLYFNGFAWQLYGCVTFRNPTSIGEAKAIIAAFLRRVESSLNGLPVACIAVPEFRWSGLGMPAIPLHFHLVMATVPRYAADLVSNAQRIWSANYGNAKIELYDSARAGARYIAKLAGGSDFEFDTYKLGYLPYGGDQDLFAAAQRDPSVPEHAKGMIRVKTLHCPKSRARHPGRR